MAEHRRYTLDPGRRRGPVASTLDLERALNDEQRVAVESGARRLLILARAGTGKTRTLIYRVARLVERGVPPERIVLATFTNRAAREMIARAEGLLGPVVRRVRAGTFHALALAALRENAAAIGLDPGFGVLPRDDATELMATCAGAAKAELGVGVAPSAEQILRTSSYAINADVSLEDAVRGRSPEATWALDWIRGVLDAYADAKARMNLLDFDDLLVAHRVLLASGTPTSERLLENVAHVLVDEYQDTNPIQCDLAERLAGAGAAIAVVGDDAQSIFSFRGARPAALQDFAARGPTEVQRLVRNYRSRPAILRGANAVLAAVPGFDAPLVADRSAGERVAVVVARDAAEEAEFVAQRALELADEGVPLSEQAVLVRAHRHVAELEIALTRRGVPYRVRAAVRFFEQAHIKDLVAFLRVLANPADRLAWRRVLALQPGVGSKSVALLLDALPREATPGAALARAAERVRLPSRAARSAARLASDLDALVARDRLAEVIRGLLAPRDPEEGTVGSLVEHIKGAYGHALRRLDELAALADVAEGYASAGAFLSDLALADDVVGEDLGAARGEADADVLTLSTVHQAKGLEWRAVFVVQLTDGGFPIRGALADSTQLEEERRLFYVALTRAKDFAYLTRPASKLMRDEGRILLAPSRFLAALPDDAHERWALDPAEAPAERR